MTTLEGTVGDLSHDARGVVRVEGKVYFVEGALPGETITFTRQKRHKRHEIGRLDSVVEAADQRVQPACEYFGVCGGCAVQHLSNPGQRQFKQRTVMENLERIGKVIPERLLDPISGPVLGYRRKARFGVRHVPSKGGVLVGFRERHKSYITSLAHCIAQPPAVSALLPALHALVAELSCFDRLPQIETAVGDAHCALVFRHLQALERSDLERLARFSRQFDVDIFLQGAGLDSVRPLDPATARQLYYLLPEHDIRIEFGPTDFIQVNGLVNQKMIDCAISLLEPGPEDEILELFCGIGNFSLPFARRAGRVLGAEADQALVERARGNALLNGLGNIEFMTADLYTDQVQNLSRHASCNKLFLDPPRSGAVEVVRDLVPKLRPERIVYVSCNPATLARDSGILVHHQGYTLKAAGIIDMFPHTAHVESIALFQR